MSVAREGWQRECQRGVADPWSVSAGLAQAVVLGTEERNQPVQQFAFRYDTL
jgi:hypothetical protein